MGYRAEIVANSLDLFEIVVPKAVEDEITARPAGTNLEFPYSTLFRHLRGKLQHPAGPEPAPVGHFGPGEAAAIALASHLKAYLLVNEHRARVYAVNLGIRTVTVPAAIVALCAQGVITGRAARTKLRLIEANTARQIVADAELALNELPRGESR